MKKIYILILIGGFFGCELTDVVDQNPPNNLVSENVVVDAASAENILNGAYSVLSNQFFYAYSETTPALLSGAMDRRLFLANRELAENDVFADNSVVSSHWLTFYEMINAANTVIDLVGKLPDGAFANVTRKQEILAEAHYLRAMAHFDALRYFGQFYNMSSELGVIIRTKPADFVTRSKKRSSVADVYQLITDDLDISIASCPDYSVSYYASKTAAKALKARVLLFMGQYAQAATLADEVITEGSVNLSSTFSSVFDDGLNSSEMIFMRFTDDLTIESDRKRFFYGSRHMVAGSWLKSFMGTDPRSSTTYSNTNSAILKVYDEDNFRPTYYMRLSEMYLIKAEGLARSGASLSDSKAPLDVIRSRAFESSQTSPASTIDELLDEIYSEIVLELVFENGSEWFAGIRFDKIMTENPDVTSVDQYILPIPETEIAANSDLSLTDQNPGYNQ